MVHVDFSARMLNLPLKTKEEPLHPFTEQEMYGMLAILFGFVFLNNDETQAFKVRQLSTQACNALGPLVKLNVEQVSVGGWITKLADEVIQEGFLRAYGNSLIRRFLKSGMSIEDAVWCMIPTAAAGTANAAQQVNTSNYSC
jgi:hypothetical protein